MATKKKTDHLVLTLRVKWDTDGQRGLKLPKEVNVEFEYNDENYNKSLFVLHEEANDIASDMIGFCVLSSIVIQVAIKKL
jgi:hypothetical protein